MASITGTVDFQKVELAIKGMPQSLSKYNQAVLSDFQKTLRDAIEINSPKRDRKAPSRQQKYSKSWKIGKITGNKAEIFTTMGKLYAILEFQGAKPSVQTPKKAKAIRFELPDGTVIFTMKVNNPGFKAIPHVRPTLRLFLQNVMPIMYSHLDKISILFKQAAQQNKTKATQAKEKMKRAIPKKG